MLLREGQDQAQPVWDVNVGMRPPPARNKVLNYLYTIPWWAVALVLIGLLIGYSIAANAVYSNIFRQLRAGIQMTLRVSATAYSLGLTLGLLIGIIRSTKPEPQTGLISGLWSFVHLITYNLATMFVEILRGLPILQVILISAYVIIPAFKDYMRTQHGIEIPFRGGSVETAIFALSMTYGAFLSEIFRSGIQAVDKGQVEAAKSLGMTSLQVLRLIVLPQALRRVLPPLGNDFIAMIKDSSLVAYLGIRDVTQIAKVTSGSSFLYMQTYLTAATIYLTMTILGSVLIKLFERRLKQE